MNNYYAKLKEIDFFKLHASYIPFVGDLYDKFKILHISESHYSDILDTSVYGIEYFSKWFDEECLEVEEAILNKKLTRRVCEGVCEGNMPRRAGMGLHTHGIRHLLVLHDRRKYGVSCHRLYHGHEENQKLRRRTLRPYVCLCHYPGGMGSTPEINKKRAEQLCSAPFFLFTVFQSPKARNITYFIVFLTNIIKIS